MRAVIMAGGEGSRLRPLTCDRPKPMIDFFGKPVMEHTINLLKKHGITEIAVTLQYMPQVIMDYFGDGFSFGVNLEYFIEKKPLGTAGSVKQAEEFLGDEFLVISGDAITNINLSEAIKFHKKSKSEATLVLSKVESPLEYGIVVTDESGRIQRFMEKPSWGEVFTNTANTGIYILNKSVLTSFEKDVKTDFSGDVFPKILEQGRPMFGFVSSDYWCDIGDCDTYIKAHRDRFISFISPNAVISPSAKIYEPVWIGEDARIGENVSVMSYSVIGNNAWISANSSVKGAILGDYARLKEWAALRGCVIGSRAQIGSHASVFEGAVIGSGARIGDFAEVVAGAKVWVGKFIRSGVLVDENVAWGANTPQSLFGERAIDGEINVDITPEFASKLGVAFGALFKGKIGVGYGSNPALIMLKNAFISGVISSGADVYDMNPTTLPITRNATVFYGLDAGIYFMGEGERVIAHVLDKNGLDVSTKGQRSLEQFFIRNDSVRAEPEGIGKITEIHDYNTFYIHQIKGEANISVSVSSGEGVVEEVARTVLTNQNAECRMQKLGGVMDFRLDNAGEVVDISDERGRKLSEYQKLYLMMDMLKNEPAVVVPHSSPMALRKHAKELGLKVITSKSGDSDILQTLYENKLQYQYGLMFDGVFLVSQIAVYFAKGGRKLADYIDKIPSAYVAKREVACEESQKGEIMQDFAMMEREADLTEGVKFARGKAWVMVRPHRAKGAMEIVAESASNEAAEELCIECSDRIMKSF